MPNDLVLVRHGHSEGNLVLGKSKKGDDTGVTQDFRETPGHRWRLTPDGSEQAKEAGQWLVENFTSGFDRYYASPFVRTRETAGLLGLPNAEWRLDQRLRERDWGEINSVPRSEHESNYPANALIKKIDSLYWRPPAGESIADVRLRVRNLFDTLHRECAGQSVIIVTHGEFMSAARASLEYLSVEEWVRRDTDSAYKIYNCHILHYSRRDPATGLIGTHLSWLRSISLENDIDTGWLEIRRQKYTNEELLEQVGSLKPILQTVKNDS